MTDKMPLLRLQDAWRECERNLYYLRSAITSLWSILPMIGETFGHLTDEQVQDLDQFILHFIKL
jgi:hypothetical protein